MNLVIIRHGDPDYEHDTLTEHGWTEAEVLAHRMEKMNVKDLRISSWTRPGHRILYIKTNEPYSHYF